MWDFDPVRLGRYEATVWVAYYQRRWVDFLRAAVGMVRVGFGMPWPRTLLGAWLVLRANQLWAPYPDNDPDGARALMEKFYRLVAKTHKTHFDVRRAAQLEVEWWRRHRYLQRENPDGNLADLIDALTDLYAYVYQIPAGDGLREAARGRAEAMVVSDRWVAAGRDPASPDLATERDLLIAGYRALRTAVAAPE